MKDRISKLVEKFIKESFVDITDMGVDEVMDEIDAVKEMDVTEDEMEEGNAFSGARAKAIEDGKDSFTVDGKTYPVKGESSEGRDEFDGRPSKVIGVYSDIKKQRMGEAKKEKFIQKATEKMEKKGTTGKFASWCKKEGLDKDGEVTKKCIDKAMKSEDSKVVKMANFAKNIGGFKGAKNESVKNKVVFTESELIKFIERIVEAETKVEKNTTNSMSKSKKINSDAVTDTVNKMKDYMKNMGMDYNEKTDKFPTGNKKMSREDFGKEITDDVKKMYTKSDAVEEYIDAFAYPGQTNIVYDEIKPNDEMIEKYLKGDSTTGNAQVDEDGNALGNVVPSETGDKFYKNYEENLYGAEQRNASYKRVPQPVETAGEGKTKGGLPKAQKIFDKLQSESLKEKKVLNDIDEMKKLINYGKKTQ